MLDNVIGGNTVENWGVSLLIVVGTIIFVKAVSLISRKLINPIVSKTQNKFDDIIYSAVESPLLFGLMLAGLWVAFRHLALPQTVVAGVGGAYTILIVLNITWLFARLVNSLLDTYWTTLSAKPKNGQTGNDKMAPMIRRTILIVVWIIGIVTALTNVGVNISALLGTLGIGGIAFALAAQDTIKNIFGAFTILTDKPFRIGDTIRMDSFEGTIIDIGLRSTKMRDYDKRIVTFPNFRIADASVINVSAEPMRRVVMKIGLTYDTTAEKMAEGMNILKEMPRKVEHVSAKDLRVNFSDFTDSALVVTFVYSIEKKGDIASTQSNVNMKILESFNNAGLSFAFPSQTLYIEKGSASQLTDGVSD